MKNKKVILGTLITSCVFASCIYGTNAKEKTSQELYIEKQCIEMSEMFDKDVKSLKEEKELRESQECKTYSDDENTLYCVKENEIIGYMKDIDTIDTNIKNKKNVKEIREIADNCMKELADGRIYKSYSFEYHEDTEMYYAVYYKYVNDFKTADKIYIYIDNMGNVIAAGNPNSGEFDDCVIKKSISEDKIASYVEKTFDTRGMGEIYYKIEDVVIEKVNNDDKLAIYIEYTIPVETEVQSELLYMDIK